MRNLDSNMAEALASGFIVPAFLVQLTFTTGTQYLWSGVGPLVWSGNTYQGVGSLGSVGTISEVNSVESRGMTLTLSGIDPTLYADSMSEIITGKPAVVYFALLSQGAIIGSPYLAYSGLIDQPTVSEGADTISITLNLSSRLTNLQRPNCRRYSSADQRMLYPTDSAFFMVEALQDIANVWG